MQSPCVYGVLFICLYKERFLHIVSLKELTRCLCVTSSLGYKHLKHLLVFSLGSFHWMLPETSTCVSAWFFSPDMTRWPLQANTDSRLLCSWCHLKGFTCFVSCGVLIRALWYDWNDYYHHFIDKPEAGRAGGRPQSARLAECSAGAGQCGPSCAPLPTAQLLLISGVSSSAPSGL